MQDIFLQGKLSRCAAGGHVQNPRHQKKSLIEEIQSALKAEENLPGVPKEEKAATLQLIKGKRVRIELEDKGFGASWQGAVRWQSFQA